MLSVKCPECLMPMSCRDKYRFHDLLKRLLYHLIFQHNVRADTAYEKARKVVRGNEKEKGA